MGVKDLEAGAREMLYKQEDLSYTMVSDPHLRSSPLLVGWFSMFAKGQISNPMRPTGSGVITI